MNPDRLVVPDLCRHPLCSKRGTRQWSIAFAAEWTPAQGRDDGGFWRC